MNRETTLFLVGIYILDAASRQIPEPQASAPALRERFAFRQAPWLRAAFLAAVWLVVKVLIYRHFADNDTSENFVRLWGNLGRPRPRLWPTLFNICGYVLPIVLVLHRRVRPLRFASYLYIFPFWLAVVFYTGVILESRIYGELCSLTAVAAVLLFEEHVLSHRLSAEKPSVASYAAAD